ncbi:MAG: phage replisome organizer N-terminal domain-containing protein [Deltaproteobacteria bacterium]|jgi:hypothetical protein|nr:phage replisome organizer N-terminal domain-containing protein [Deltaproteobacteria bacterium]
MDDIIKEIKDTDKNIDIDTPKYIKLPFDFFLIPEIKALDNYPEKDKLILSWIKLVLFAAKLDNEGKLQVKSTSANRKKYNPMDPGNHLYAVLVMFITGLSKKEEQGFAIKAIDIFFKEGLLGRNDNPNEPYLYVKNWNEFYKASKPGKKTEWTKKRVEDILKENDYNMTRAAQTVGNTKQFISLLAKKFGIKKPVIQKDNG